MYQAKSRQPEIIRAVQKDQSYTNELAEDLSHLLQGRYSSRPWLKHNVCRLVAEIIYHGFASINDLQTLGEEYTGIIQIDSDFRNIPPKIVQLLSIILEFGGEVLYMKILEKTQKAIEDNEEIVPEAKQKLKRILEVMKSSTAYIKVLHKSIFYLNSNKYHISKRFTGINYALIRHWLKPDQSLYGYRFLGWITLLQFGISLLINFYDRKEQLQREAASKACEQSIAARVVEIHRSQAPQCILCLEPRVNTTLTPCGHLFCWNCILECLDEKDECPMCREFIKKSNVIQLLNYI